MITLCFGLDEMKIWYCFFLLQVRQLLDGNGRAVTEAVPSTPVQILGWRTLPSLGDHFLVVDSEVCFLKGIIPGVSNLYVFYFVHLCFMGVLLTVHSFILNSASYS